MRELCRCASCASLLVQAPCQSHTHVSREADSPSSPAQNNAIILYTQYMYTWPYLAGFAAVALAASSETRWLQTSMFCLLVFVWSRTSVPRRRHISGLRKSSTAATLFHRQIVCRSTHTQHIRRQERRCRRATCLEQSSGPLARRGHYIRQFQARTQNVLF